MFWKKLLLCFSITALLYLPNIFVFFNRFIESSGGTWVQPPSGLDSVYNMLWIFSNAPLVTIIIISLIVFSILKYMIYFKKEQKEIYFGFVVFWFVFVFCFMYVVSFWIPMFLDRYLMTAAIAFPLVVGISADYLIRKPKYEFIIPIVIALLFVLTVKPDISNKRDVKETVSKIKELKTSNTIVYFCPDYFDINFVYYFNLQYFKQNKDKNNMLKLLNTENIFPIYSYEQIDTSVIKYKDKIIFLDAAADFCYPKNNIKHFLNTSHNLINQYKFYEIFNVYEYELK